MENSSLPNGLPEKSKPPVEKNIWLFISILIAVVTIIVLGYIYIYQKDSKEDVIIQENNVAQSGIFSYIGVITTIEENKLTVAADLNENKPGISSTAEILIDEQTEFKQVRLPERVEEVIANKPEVLFNRTDSQLNEFKKGDKVIVTTYENIKGQSSFRAKKIEVISIK